MRLSDKKIREMSTEEYLEDRNQIREFYRKQRFSKGKEIIARGLLNQNKEVKKNLDSLEKNIIKSIRSYEYLKNRYKRINKEADIKESILDELIGFV